MTVLRPGQRPPAVTMPTRVQLGSWNIFSFGPAFSNVGRCPSFVSAKRACDSLSVAKTRSPSATYLRWRTGDGSLHGPSVFTVQTNFSRSDSILSSMADIGYLFDLKYSIVFARPSLSGTFGSQPRSAFASVMSGLRRFGSSSGSGL